MAVVEFLLEIAVAMLEYDEGQTVVLEDVVYLDDVGGIERFQAFGFPILYFFNLFGGYFLTGHHVDPLPDPRESALPDQLAVHPVVPLLEIHRLLGFRWLGLYYNLTFLIHFNLRLNRHFHWLRHHLSNWQGQGKTSLTDRLHTRGQVLLHELVEYIRREYRHYYHRHRHGKVVLVVIDLLASILHCTLPDMPEYLLDGLLPDNYFIPVSD